MNLLLSKRYTRRQMISRSAKALGGAALLLNAPTLVSCATRRQGGKATTRGVKKVAIPRLNDHHSHTSLYIALLGSKSFWDVGDKASAMKIINESPADELTLIRGWNSNKFTFSDDELAKMPPVIVVHYSLHRINMSRKAEEMLLDKQPEIIKNYKDLDWYEKNIDKVLSFIGSIPKFEEDNIADHYHDIRLTGVDQVQDMLLVSKEALQKVRASPVSDKIGFWASPDLYKTLSPESKADMLGIKVFTDGSMGGKTSAMNKPYRDETTKGMLCYTDDGLLEVMRFTAKEKKPISLHVIGDRALDQVLAALKKVKAEGLWFPLVRVEHAQFITKPQAQAFKERGVVLCMQPNFSQDSIDLAETLPEGYPEINNPFRMLIDDVGYVPGKDLIFGSDGMPHGVECGMGNALFPPYKGQELTFDEFIKGYTNPNAPAALQVEIDYDRKQVRLLEPAELRESI